MTNRTTQAVKRDGYAKGEHKRYVKGHIGRRREEEWYRLEDRGYVTPCWISSSTRPNGYGFVWTGGRCYRIHRFLWERENGPVPEGLELDHLCRVRACCNPAHLEAVTHTENVRRSPHLTKVSQDDVYVIAASDEGATVLAARYGVTRGRIWQIRAQGDRLQEADVAFP